MAINLDFGRNGLLKLKSIKDVKKWAQEERQAWNWLNGRTGRYNTDVVVRQFRAGWDAIQSILDAGDESAIKKQLNELYGDDGKLILSTSPAGQFLFRMAENDEMIANAAAFYFGLHEVPRQYKVEAVFLMAHIAWVAFTEGLPGVKGELTSIRLKGKQLVLDLRKQSEKFSNANDEFIKDSAELIDGLRKEYGSLAKGFTGEHTSFMDKAQKEYDELKQFYKTELALKAPVEYWAKVAKRHKIWTSVWGVLFASLLSGLVYLILQYAEDVRDFLANITRETIAITLTIAVATVIFWTLRMVSKIFLSNYQRAVDAAERETMVKTFLALRREKHITDEQLDLVLRPLFRPGITGLVRDDSAPEYGFAAMLSKEFGKR